MALTIYNENGQPVGQTGYNKDPIPLDANGNPIGNQTIWPMPLDPGGGSAGGGGQQQPKNSFSPYTLFTQLNRPTTDPTATNLAGNLAQNYKNISYTPKTASSYVPPEVLAQLGQATGDLANYKPEKIDVAKIQTMPVEYYQKQIEDLSKPLTDQYNLARANARGDQAARGTIYDSEGYKDIGQLDKSYLDQLGNITRGVQESRMANEYAASQDYANKLFQEAADRRSLGLQGLTGAGNLLSNVFQNYGTLGQSESKLGSDTALQNKGLDVNALTSSLGYLADRYKTESGLFSDIYGADTNYNQNLIDDSTKRYLGNLDNAANLLGLSGYTNSPQTQAYNNLLYMLGLITQGDMQPKSEATNPTLPNNTYQNL